MNEKELARDAYDGTETFEDATAALYQQTGDMERAPGLVKRAAARDAFEQADGDGDAPERTEEACADLMRYAGISYDEALSLVNSIKSEVLDGEATADEYAAECLANREVY